MDPNAFRWDSDIVRTRLGYKVSVYYNARVGLSYNRTWIRVTYGFCWTRRGAQRFIDKVIEYQESKGIR